MTLELKFITLTGVINLKRRYTKINTRINAIGGKSKIFIIDF